MLQNCKVRLGIRRVKVFVRYQRKNKEESMRKIYGVIGELFVVALFICGCGNNVDELTNEEPNTEIIEETTTETTFLTTEEVTTEETTIEEIVTEQLNRNGSRSNPFIIGDDFDMHFFGYTIQSYGDVNGKILDYSDGNVTFLYSLDNFGSSNPLFFPVEFGYANGIYTEKNQVIYVYPCDNPGVFTVSDSEYFASNSDVAIACGESGEVTYNVGEQEYLAVVWYTLSEDGGDYDFLDGNLYGHFVFVDLRK
jgi:hypothetical protein